MSNLAFFPQYFYVFRREKLCGDLNLINLGLELFVGYVKVIQRDHRQVGIYSKSNQF